jgi:DUF971 family protein
VSTTNPKMPHHPVEVNLKEAERRLVVTWEDGHVSDFPLRYLRGFCPCASCQGHRSGPPEFVQTHNETISDVRQIGAYAMNVMWDSGHDTGIYSFNYLRDLCPCAEHKPDGLDPDWL